MKIACWDSVDDFKENLDSAAHCAEFGIFEIALRPEAYSVHSICTVLWVSWSHCLNSPFAMTYVHMLSLTS